MQPAGGAQQDYRFQVLLTGKYDSHKPLMFIDQAIAVVSVKSPVYGASVSAPMRLAMSCSGLNKY